MHVHTYIHISILVMCIHNYIYIYTRSPLEDSRLFGPSPWKVLALVV